MMKTHSSRLYGIHYKITIFVYTRVYNINKSVYSKDYLIKLKKCYIILL